MPSAGRRGVTDQQLVDDMPGDHEAVAAIGVGRVGLPPAAVVGDAALHAAVVAQARVELDEPRLGWRVGVLDGVGEHLHHGQVQRFPIVGGGVEAAQPAGEGIPRRGQAGPLARQLQVQRRDRIGEPLRGQRGDVVGVAGPGQQLHGPLAYPFRRGQVGAGRQRLAGRHRELGHALGDGPVRLCDEAVAVQQDQLTRGERADREDGVRAGAERPRPGALEVPGRPVDPDDQRRGMPAGGVAQRSDGRVEHRQGECGGAQGRHPGGKGVGPPQDLPEVGLRGEQFGQHGAQLPHRRRGGDPVSHHVTDDERDAAAGQRDRVEPVVADRLLVPGDQVPGRDPGPRQHRQRGRQQRFLQFGHDLAGVQYHVGVAHHPPSASSRARARRRRVQYRAPPPPTSSPAGTYPGGRVKRVPRIALPRIAHIWVMTASPGQRGPVRKSASGRNGSEQH